MPGLTGDSGDREWVNWTRDQRCRPRRVERPRDLGELTEALAAAADRGERVKVTGSGHSFNDSAMTEATMIDIGALNSILDVDRETATVRVAAGITIAKLSKELDSLGLALENLGDIDSQTIAGAISTATHGTGAELGNISSQVEGLDLVTADGTVVELGGGGAADAGRAATEEDRPAAAGDAAAPAAAAAVDDFLAARVGLGALGAIASVTLRCVPSFTLHRVDRPEPLDSVLDRFDELAATNEHFEFFVFPYTRKALTICRNRTDRPPRPRGAARRFVTDVVLENGVGDLAMRLARARRSMIPRLTGMAASLMSRGEQLDKSFRLFANRRTIRFTEMEYAVPREAGPEAIDAVLGLIERERLEVPMPIECRVVAADESLLSPSFRRDSTYIAVHQYQGMQWREFFEAVEEIMRGLDGRPHWGKRHGRTAADLAPAYPRWEDFAGARDRLDPGRTFANPYTDRVLGP